MPRNLLDAQPRLAQAADEVAVEPVRLLRRRGRGVAGPPAAARVPVERELRDGEQVSARVEDGEVHLALAVGKDAQVEDLVRQGVGVGFLVALPHAEQDEEAGADLTHDLAVDAHGRLGDALDDRAHAQGLSSRTDRPPRMTAPSDWPGCRSAHRASGSSMR